MTYAKHMKHGSEAGESSDSPASVTVSGRRKVSVPQISGIQMSGTQLNVENIKKKKRSQIWLILSIIALVAGLALISYPFVSDWLNQQAQNEVTATQEKTVTAMKKEDLSSEKEKAIAFNKHLRDGSSKVIDPFDSKDTMPGNEEYKEVLNVAGDGTMGELIIPKISVDLPIYHFTTDKVLQHGVGHVVNTSVPIGGESTHCVLAGHTGLPTARIFDKLNELSVNDWFIVRVLGEDHAYRVTSTEVVLPEEVNSLSIEPGKDQVTLVTCTPYGVNTHRLLVHAERCEVPAEWESSKKLVNRSVEPLADLPRHMVFYSIAGILVTISIILGIVFAVKFHKKRSNRSHKR